VSTPPLRWICARLAKRLPVWRRRTCGIFVTCFGLKQTDNLKGTALSDNGFNVVFVSNIMTVMPEDYKPATITSYSDHD
jgi:hypothetical protein